MNNQYPFEVHPLTEEDGRGWLITFPDLPGCMSDGETPEAALANGKDALSAWINTMEESGWDVPLPSQIKVANV